MRSACSSPRAGPCITWASCHPPQLPSVLAGGVPRCLLQESLHSSYLDLVFSPSLIFLKIILVPPHTHPAPSSRYYCTSEKIGGINKMSCCGQGQASAAWAPGGPSWTVPPHPQLSRFRCLSLGTAVGKARREKGASRIPGRWRCSLGLVPPWAPSRSPAEKRSKWHGTELASRVLPKAKVGICLEVVF